MALPTLAQLKSETGRIADRQKASDLLRRFEAASAAHSATQDPAEKTGLETELQGIYDEARAAAASNPTLPQEPAKFLTPGGYAIAILLILLISFGTLLYFKRLPESDFSSIEGTRPLLVMALIISMLGFGGMLMVRSLYGSLPREELEVRFRLAREVFLVFAGIFGTIIGFYFGASDDEDVAEAPTIEIAFADGQVTAAVAGGAEPFLGIFTAQGQSGGVVMVADGRMLTHQVEPCPDGASVLVMDGRGRRAEGTVDCPAEEPDEAGNDANAVEPDNGTNAAGNAAG